MLYQFPTCGGLKFKILCAIWECQSFTKEKKGLGKIPHLSLVAKPLVTHGEFYFSPLVASPLRGEKSNPFFSSVKDWVIPRPCEQTFPYLFSRCICVSWNDHFTAMELFHFLDQFLGLQISQCERNCEDQWLNCKNRFAKRVHLLPIHL